MLLLLCRYHLVANISVAQLWLLVCLVSIATMFQAILVEHRMMKIVMTTTVTDVGVGGASDAHDDSDAHVTTGLLMVRIRTKSG